MSLALLYALLMGLTGQGWHWLLAPLAIAVGGGSQLGTIFARIRGQRSGFVWMTWIELARWIWYIGVVAVFVHATFVSGIWALWQNSVVSLNIPRLLLALFVLAMDWHYCRTINNLFDLEKAVDRIEVQESRS
jgi:hypothetical protein